MQRSHNLLQKISLYFPVSFPAAEHLLPGRILLIPKIPEYSGAPDKSLLSEQEALKRRETQLQSEETTVYADRETNEPFVSKENRPAVEGVLILAEGGDSTAVKQNISDAVLALFHVDAHKIKVVKMSVQEAAE